MLDVRNKRVTVAGLGRFGGQVAAARWLVERRARVLVTDKDPAEKLGDSVAQLAGLPIEFRLGEHREADFSSADLVVASPAIPPTSPYLIAAHNAGVPITAEIRLFVERCPATVIGVTGTKGKSTTTALLGRMLATRFTTHVGGNIGKPLLNELDRIDKTDMVVLELSSFMLHYLGQMHWSPHIAVVTLIAPDHLEWHGTFEAYVEDKRNIVRYQHPDDFVIVNEENEPAVHLAGTSQGRVVRYGVAGRRPFELVLPGRHNQLNAQGAFAAASQLGVTWDEAQAAIRDFSGLDHRLQLVHEAAGIRWFDDSIATVPEAAIAALEAFPPRTVIQIVGGSGKKKVPLTPLSAALSERAKAALCIGETGPQIAELMAKSGGDRCAPAYVAGDLATAVTIARQLATTGDTVLLSTGCASFDQFANFEERGRTFTKLARAAGT